MYIRNSGVAHAPLSILDTMKTRFMKPPQNDFRLVGPIEFPPIALVPSRSHGYMVMLAQ